MKRPTKTNITEVLPVTVTIINESGLNVITADDLDDAAQKIVNAVKG